MIFDKDGMPESYDTWIKEYPAEVSVPRFDLIATGAGGILYPPNALNAMVFDKEAILTTCIDGDDLWLKTMELANNTPVVLAANQKRLNFIADTQECSLYKTNVDEKRNDQQMKAILAYLRDKKQVDIKKLFESAQSDYLKTSERPKVSIVMPVFNVANYLRAAIDSVLQQTLHDIEVICVNDGSTDNSLQILQSYAQKDKRVIIIDKKNSGYGDSMNVGMKAAKGEYIGIVETDDFISPDMYLTLYCIAHEKNLDLIKADYHTFFGDGEARTTKYISIAGKYPDYYNKVIDIKKDVIPVYFTMNTWAGIYKKEYLEKHNIQHNVTPGASYQDSGFWFQTFIWSERMYFLNRPFYMYRQDNPLSSINNPNKVYCVCDEYEFIYSILDKHPDLKKLFIKIFVYRRFYSYLFALGKMGAQYKYDFLKRFSKDFGLHKTRDEIDPMLFTVGEINKLNSIISNPEKYYINNYYKDTLPNNDIKLKYALLEKRFNMLQTDYDRFKNTTLYSIFDKYSKIKRLVTGGINCLKQNGFKYTLKRIKQKIDEYKTKKIEVKAKFQAQKVKYNENKILFIASDNSESSGAFLSMTNLAYILKRDYKLKPFVILPKGGKGGILLDKYGIGHKTITSYNWVMPMDQKKNAHFRKEKRNNIKENKKAIDTLSKYIINENYSLVHINTTYSYVGALAAQKANVPIIWHLREFLEEDQSKTLWDRNKGNSLINKSDKVITISHKLYEKYEKVIDPSRLMMIYNGINEDLFYKPNKEIFAHSKPIFIFVGGFAIYKGHIEFAKACLELALRGYTDYEIWFIGTGNTDIREQVISMFEEAGLSENIKILGYKENVADYYEKADLAFTCSISEAFGRITVEAMMSGVLAIGANAAGTVDLIKDNETGLLYESGNYIDLANKIEYALNNRGKMKTIAAQGREFMKKNMTAKINAEKIYGIYKELLYKQNEL
jgi:glycosyltransferase involved in cell wall biosynthesis